VNFLQSNLVDTRDTPHIQHPGKVDDGVARISAIEFREALSKLASSVAVVTTGGPRGFAGVTCSAFCTVSDSPPTLLACVGQKSAANEILKTNGVLCVNALCETQIHLSNLFSGVGKVPMAERFSDESWHRLLTGSPCNRNAVAAFDCRITEVRDVGAHSVFLAEVLATACSGDRPPLVYRSREYATTRAIA
jgi:flavin reductase (NADH)/flavin reductase/chlorophenol-4-monooxygenase component 1